MKGFALSIPETKSVLSLTRYGAEEEEKQGHFCLPNHDHFCQTLYRLLGILCKIQENAFDILCVGPKTHRHQRGIRAAALCWSRPVVQFLIFESCVVI